MIINPAFTAASQIVDIDHNMKNIDLNKAHWHEKVEEYEEKMNKEKQSLLRRQSIKLAV